MAKRNTLKRDKNAPKMKRMTRTLAVTLSPAPSRGQEQAQQRAFVTLSASILRDAIRRGELYIDSENVIHVAKQEKRFQGDSNAPA